MKFNAWFFSMLSIGALVHSGARASEWDQAVDPYPQPGFRNSYRPLQTEPAPAVSPADPQIREILRRVGLSSDRIERLQKDQFDYGRVQESVEDALVNEGQGRENARRRAADIAQQVHRLRSSAESSQRFVARPTDPGVSNNGWRNQELREKLEQAGLPDSVISALERDQFPPSRVEQKVRDSLLDRGYPADSAELRARNLSNQIRTIQQDAGRAPSYQQQSGSGQSFDRDGNGERLRQAGLSPRQIERLERRGYPADQVRILVEDRLEEEGFPAAEAERQAQQLAAQFQR